MLIILNFIVLAIAVANQSPNGSPWNTANKVAADLQFNGNGYSLSVEQSAKLKEQDIWAILIANGTQQMIWQTDNLPDNIPNNYTLSDIANLTRGYIEGYPTFTGETEYGLLVLGYPKESFWKHMWASWDYRLIANLPLIALLVFGGNITVIFLIYIVVNTKLLRSLKPITNGIQDLPAGNPVSIKETGLLSEVAVYINKTSKILQEQRIQLQNLDGNHALEWNTEDTLSSCVINADKDLLKRAVANLIQNSINHNEAGCTVYISVKDADSDCIICVEDNGISASDEQLEALNTAQHYMVCDTNITEQRHGLGLLIVKQIVAGHNGKMEISHSAYGGFQVILTIPK